MAEANSLSFIGKIPFYIEVLLIISWTGHFPDRWLSVGGVGDHANSMPRR